MKKWTKTAGLLFMAASSVYYGQAVVAAPGKSAPAAGGAKSPTATDVRLLEELIPTALPVEKGDAADAAAAATPLTADSAAPGAAPAPATTAPATPAAPAKPEGRSVSKSEVQVSDEGTVEIHVNDASLVEVLRMLSLQSQKNIVCSKEVRGTVTANLYNVTIREALDQVLHMNGYAYREKGNFINVYTVKELQQIEEAEKRATTEVFRLHYTPAANAMTMIKPVLSTLGQVSATTPAVSGVTSGGGETGGNGHAVEDMLVVTDFPENIDKVRKVLKDLDRRPQQVLVEATILRAALTEDNALGVDFNVLAGVKFNQIITNAGGQVTGANTQGQANLPLGTNGLGSAGSGNSFTSSIPGGMKVGFVSDNVSVFLAALEGVTDTVVLANPKVLALNKHKGEIIVGRKDGYMTSTQTETSTVQTVEFLDTGTKLIFRPYIAADGYVRMEVHPEDSSGGLTGANLPFKITTEMTSNIMVKDGHTVVIGGLFREASDSARSQTPFLGNLPVAGALFRNQRDRTTREEIIILLTPHVIKDDEVYGKLGDEELRRADKLRVGVRKGMMPWGRERLAEGEYEKALAELAKPAPNNQKALWHLDCATNLNPKFLEAIEMKQRITGRVVTASDNSSVRLFVRNMVLNDRGMVTPAAGADAPVTPPPAGKSADADPAKPGTAAAADADPFAGADGDDVPLDRVAPELQPEAGVVVNAKPATQPATTQPATTLAGKPTTQPAAVAADKGDAKGEKGESAKADAKADKKPADDGEETPSTSVTKSEQKTGEAGTPAFTVTELPIEEVKPEAPSADDNK
jgi:type IV pilus assembly protein PilQ